MDNSKDEINRFLAEHKNLIFLENKINLGKGGSIRTAIAEASGEYTVIQDADLELNPNEINDLIIPVLNNEADIVYGSRFINSNKKEKESILNRIANKFLYSFWKFLFWC